MFRSMVFSSEVSSPICVDLLSSKAVGLNVNFGRASGFGFLDACRLCAREGEEGGLLDLNGDGGGRTGETETEAILAVVTSFEVLF